MNIPKIIEAFGDIDDKFLKEAELPERKRFRFKPTLLAAIIAIIALSTGAAAVSYTDYAAVYKKAALILESCFSPQRVAEAVPLSAKKKEKEDKKAEEKPAPVSYVSSASGLEQLKYLFDRETGLQCVSPFTEEETSPEFTDLTTEHEIDCDYYYREFGEEIPDPTKFPWLESLEEYGNELTTEGEFMTGDFRVSAVMCDDHYFYAVLQYALPEHVKEALKDIPDDTYLSFYNCRITPSGGYLGVSPIALEDGVLTFMLSTTGYESYPDEFEISISGFGYRYMKNSSDYHPLCEAKASITIPADKLKKLDNRIAKPIKYPTKDGDVDLSAELSPFGIMFRFSSENKKAAENMYFGPSDAGIGFNNLRIFLEDGSVYGSGKTYFGLHYILAGHSGFAVNYEDIDPTNDVYYISIPFANAVDIDKIEKISVNGYELVFED